MPPEEYLKEEFSPIKYKYIDGQLYAMAGASDGYVTIAGNLFALLINYLGHSGGRTYMSDMKAHIEITNTFFYPDIMVICDARDKALPNHKKYICLIVEILFDQKLANYFVFPTI
ncbi:Uma2 family endonuclease [Trichodesmium erythraeum 21-75]|nr:Uma2 family endonuclease [Trichodesmium erythraeum 21-75]